MTTKSIFEAVEDEDELTAKMVAENAWGAALDNGSDMHGVNPLEHAENEYEGYIEHIIIMAESALSEHGRELSEETCANLEEEAVSIIEERED